MFGRMKIRPPTPSRVLLLGPVIRSKRRASSIRPTGRNRPASILPRTTRCASTPLESSWTPPTWKGEIPPPPTRSTSVASDAPPARRVTSGSENSASTKTLGLSSTPTPSRTRSVPSPPAFGSTTAFPACRSAAMGRLSRPTMAFATRRQVRPSSTQPPSLAIPARVGCSATRTPTTAPPSCSARAEAVSGLSTTAARRSSTSSKRP
mmetsp:Transcript_9918/g.21434  ORF Transcript_9918/g.21434 Transcript_9918/m.21434 type:complete len:207 (+) Transcript_9918:470-1090(+)